MSLFLDSFWRAAAYCLHPRVIVLSLLPLLAMVLLAVGLGWLYWDAAVQATFDWLQSMALFATFGQWLSDAGLGGLRNVMAPLIIIAGITPLVILAVLLLVAMLMMPAVVKLVERRRFAQLERKHGGSFLQSALWSLGSTVLALAALVVSIPLWLIPPLILVLPPLIWGWLTYRVMAFDALAEHASREERRAIVREHRLWLLAMGVGTGYLGAAPSVLWASGWFFVAAFPVLVPVAIWIYTLVFAFASLWFAHYCLAALEQLRAAAPAEAVVPPPATLALPDEHQHQP